MRIVCISDTHTLHESVQVPDGDILIFAGDMCSRGSLMEAMEFTNWIASLKFNTKIVIAGNHDRCFEKSDLSMMLELVRIHYLQDNCIIINGLKIYGSPQTPFFFDWAFNRHRGEDIKRYWDLIPIDTDILITHGPPRGVLDKVARDGHVGCDDLKNRISELSNLKLHVFGHIHEGYGQVTIDNVQYVNASICTASYSPTNRPIVIDL